MEGEGGVRAVRRVSEWNKKKWIKFTGIYEILVGSIREWCHFVDWLPAILFKLFNVFCLNLASIFLKSCLLLQKLVIQLQNCNKTFESRPWMTTHRELVHRHRESYQARTRWRCACRHHEIIVVISSSLASNHERLRWNHKNRRRKSMHSLW